jgi:hypothetical protein
MHSTKKGTGFMKQRYLVTQALRLFLIVLGSLFTVVLSACSGGSGQNPQTNLTIVHIDASWHTHYASVKDAKRDPEINLIIAGTVTTLKPSQKQGPLVTTEAIFTITRVAWNPHNLSVGSTLAVNALGGTIGNVVYQVDDFPMYQVGEHEILFLHFDSATGKAETLGGPSGRLRVQNGIVKPLNDQGMNVPSNIDENTFLASILSA